MDQQFSKKSPSIISMYYVQIRLGFLSNVAIVTGCLWFCRVKNKKKKEKAQILRQQFYLRKQQLNDVCSQSIIDTEKSQTSKKSFKVLKVISSDTFLIT